MRWLGGLVSSILLRRKSKEDDSNIILQPKQWSMILFVLSFVMIALFLFSILAPNEFFASNDDRIGLVISSICLWLLNMVLCYYLLIWKIEVFDSYFKLRTIFKKKTILYDNIEIRDFNSGYRFYEDNMHLVSISYLQDNYRLLSDTIKKYQKVNKIKVKKTNTNTLYGFRLLWIPATLLLILTIFTSTVIFIYEGVGFEFYIALPFNLLPIFTILCVINCKIEFNETHLIKRSIFGFKRNYVLTGVSYKIKQFFGNPHDTILYYRNKRISFILGNTNNLFELQSILKPKD